MKKFTILFIIFFLFFSNFSFANSKIDFNTQIDKVINLSNDLDTLLDRYTTFLNNYPNYDGYEEPSEIEYLNRQLSVYQSHVLSDLSELRDLYSVTVDLKDKAKIARLYSILTQYLITLIHLRLFYTEEDKASMLFLANEYKSSADRKLQLLINNNTNA
ncbi:hypothetical protein [Faecalimicrobium sp. JNUCC 81]